MDHQENNKIMENNITPIELIEKSKIHIESLKMDVVPYSIVLQVLSLTRVNNLLDSLPDILKEASTIENKLKEILEK